MKHSREGLLKILQELEEYQNSPLLHEIDVNSIEDITFPHVDFWMAMRY